VNKDEYNIGENGALYVRRHLFYEFLFVYLFFLLHNDVVMTWLQHSVWCITHSFQLWR